MYSQIPTCFFIAPENEASEIHHIVSDACARTGVELLTPKTTNRNVVDSIQRADFVIADLSDRNPNSIFQVGVAYGLHKRILTLSQKIDEALFDLVDVFILQYRPTDIKTLNHYLNDWLREMAANTPV